MSNENFRYQTVEKHILSLIDSQALSPGERLPSLRNLSQRMNASISTVNQAYLELEKRGMIESRERSGFFVRADFREIPPPAHCPRPTLEPTMGNRSELIRTVLSAIGDKSLLPLGIVSPAAELLPAKSLARFMAQVVRENPERSVGYESIQGNLELRRQIAFRSIDAGISVSPDDIMITSGTIEALNLALRTITRPGDNILVQSPTYYCLLHLLENCGLRAIEIPSHPETGVSPEDVAQAIRKFDIRVCLFSPNFSNPDGGLTPDEAKKEIVEMLAEQEIPLIEDDVTGDLNFESKRPNAFKAFDRKGLVIHCSSFSKTLAPGYRAGWMIPGVFLRRTLDSKAITNVSSPTPTQMAIAAYLQHGNHDRHLKKLRGAIANQVRDMQLYISKVFPAGTRTTRPKGGAVLWVELPEAIDSIDFFDRAHTAGISIAPGAIFSTQDKYNNFIRLSCSRVWNEQIQAGIKTLGEIAEEMLK